MNEPLQSLVYRLVIRADVWKRAFAELATGRRRMAWGEVLRSYHSSYCDLIMRRMRFSDQPPDGNQRQLLSDWSLIDAPTDSTPADILSRLANSHARPGQLIVYVQPGLGPQHDGWIGFIYENDQMQPLREILLVGSGMKTIRRPSSSKKIHEAKPISKGAEERWSRLIGAIGIDTFRRHRSMKVMLVGAGRLGSLLASTLFRSGVRDWTIVDPDSLEPHNRDCTFGNKPSDVGKGKAGVLARYLHRVHPTSRITAIEKGVNDEIVLGRMRRADIVFTCVDNDECRAFVAGQCARLLKVHIDLGTIVRKGASVDQQANSSEETFDREIAADVRMMLPGACLACVGGLQPQAETQTQELPSWNADGRLGSLVSINQIAVGVAQQMYFDLLAERIQSSFWQRIQWVQGEGLRVASGAVAGNPNCSVCSGR